MITSPSRTANGSFPTKSFATSTACPSQSGLALAFQKTFQFRRGIKMIFDRVLSAPCNDNDVLDPGSDAFLDNVLDQRFVDDGKHFLGLRLLWGKESGP